MILGEGGDVANNRTREAQIMKDAEWMRWLQLLQGSSSMCAGIQ